MKKPRLWGNPDCPHSRDLYPSLRLRFEEGLPYWVAHSVNSAGADADPGGGGGGAFGNCLSMFPDGIYSKISKSVWKSLLLLMFTFLSSTKHTSGCIQHGFCDDMRHLSTRDSARFTAHLQALKATAQPSSSPFRQPFCEPGLRIPDVSPRRTAPAAALLVGLCDISELPGSIRWAFSFACSDKQGGEETV